ncbi:MAG: endonuclease V [Oscillospiraceae bacterium]
MFDTNYHDEKYFQQVQHQLAKKIDLHNRINPKDINLVAGVDLAYWNKDSLEYAVCCIVIIDYHTHEIVEKQYSYNIIDMPYISGFLAFRELPLVVETVKKIQNVPDIFMFDGNGYLHPNHMGLATHSSFILDAPTIGVAKSYYKIHDTDFIQPSNELNSYTDIVINGEVYGRAVKSARVKRPIFVSCGNFIDLDTAMNITLSLVHPTESRLPISTRYADLETHIMREKLKGI